MIKAKRIYDGFEKGDGFRVLVDRLWPRGISKEEAKIDLWLKEIAPSTALRKWFNHQPQKWADFQQRYKNELGKNQEAVAALQKIITEHKLVTLLYAAKDTDHNNAVVLLEYLK